MGSWLLIRLDSRASQRYIRSMGRSSIITFLAASLLVHLALISHSRAQAILLPGPSPVARGEGNCGDLIVGIASTNWRVRKGRTFEVSAIHPFSSGEGVTYQWAVSNGRILSGQGSRSIEVRAGGEKTPGFVNARGFVS